MWRRSGTTGSAISPGRRASRPARCATAASRWRWPSSACRAGKSSSQWRIRFPGAAGRKACHELLDRDLGLTALVAANDLIALGCYDALAERGLACPADVSVTGYNDAPFVDMVMPPLTTVRIRQREMGIEAARLLLERMANPQAAAIDILLRPTLVERRSTAAPKQSPRRSE